MGLVMFSYICVMYFDYFSINLSYLPSLLLLVPF